MVDIIEFLSSYDSILLAILIIGILTVEVFLLTFPKEVVMLYSGIVFGTLFGGLLNLAGLIGAFVLGYEGGRYSRFGLEKHRNKPVIQKYNHWLAEYAIRALILLRIFPFTPNDILSISSGFSRLHRVKYLIISLITAIPYAFLIAYLGDIQLDFITNAFPTIFDPISWLISFTIIIVISVLLIINGTNNEDTNL